MADRIAVLIAADAHQDPDLPAAPHAEGDAAALSRALAAIGFARDAQVLLLGSAATRTSVESKLRKLAKSQTPEALFVFFAGHGFREGGDDYLACFDTQADDLAETSVRLESFLAALDACKPKRLALFLDLRGPLGGEAMSHGQLEKAFAKRPDAACFVSAGEGEQSHASGTLKAGVWAHHLVEALSGKAVLAAEGDEQVTAASLQEHLAREVPRSLRASFREAPEQTPVAYGPKGRLVLADLRAVVEGGKAAADPRLQPLHRASLRGEATAKVKSLAGFRKFHKVPDRVNPGNRKFVAELAAEDVKSDVDQVYAAVRELLGYKRRDVEGSADRGTGFVRTPDFEYAVSVDLADDDPTAVVWRREVACIRNPEVVLGEPFRRVFGGMFDTLAFEFTGPFDIEAWVDRIEEETPPGVKLRCASDCSTCDVMVGGFAGVIRLYRDRVEVRGQAKPGSGGLVDAFLRFQDLFAGRGDIAQLPLLENKKG